MPGTAASAESVFFDERAREEGIFDPFTDRGWEVLAECFAEAVAGVAEGGRLLDVGCGTGASRRVYDRWTADYTGLDLSFGGLRIAAAGAPDRRWVASDASRLPFPNHSFDVVAFSSVLHHVPAMGIALEEAARILRPQGRIFAFDPNVLHPAMFLFRHPVSPFYTRRGVSPNERPLHPRELRQAFLAAGFQRVEQQCRSGITYGRVAPPLLDAGLALFNRADRLWQKIGLGRRFGTFIIISAVQPAEESR